MDGDDVTFATDSSLVALSAGGRLTLTEAGIQHLAQNGLEDGLQFSYTVSDGTAETEVTADMDLTDTDGMATLGTSGADVLTWDASDLFVNGGDGLDILLGGAPASKVYDVEAIVSGEAPVNAENIADYGIGLTDDKLTLDGDKWSYDSASGKATYKGDADDNGTADLTVQIDTSAVTLQSSEPSVDELVFILNSTGA